jgi:hypothetical protein
MKAIVNTDKGSFSVTIKEVKIKMTEAQYEKMERKFNKETRALEWVGGTTYCVSCNGHRLKSSSLDELFEMFKAAYNNLPIPERKCFMLEGYKPKTSR